MNCLRNRGTPTTVVFVIPFKSRAVSKNWEADCELLQNTLGSIDCQDSNNHRSIVVCNEIPELSCNFERVEFVTTERRISGVADRTAAQADKTAKGLLGLRHAAQYSPRCVMVLDADDLLHRSIVSYIESRPDHNAFLINPGYIHGLGNSTMRQSRSFHHACGSTMLYPFYSSWLESEPGSESVYARIVTHHNKQFVRDLEALDVKILRIPFFAAVYTKGIEGNMRGMNLRTQPKAENKPATRYSLKRRITRNVERFTRYVLGHQPIDAMIRSGFPTLSKDLTSRSPQASPQQLDTVRLSEDSSSFADPVKVSLTHTLWLSICRKLGLG